MTDEERKALVINLRWLGKLDYEPEIANPCLKAADEIERLNADKLNAEYQRDTALAELKDQELRLKGLAKRVVELEACVKAWQKM